MFHWKKLALGPVAAALALLQACGGGGGDAGSAPPPPAPATSPAGIYQAPTGASPSALVFVGGEGQMIGTLVKADATRSDRAAFSGVSIANVGAPGWSMPNALVYTESHPVGGAATVNTVRTTITGSVAGGSFLSISLPDSARPSALPGTVTLPYAGGDWVAPASLATLAGRYVSTVGAGPTQTVNADFSIGATGAISGQFTPLCSVQGTIGVPDATRNVYAGSVTLSGSGCPVTPGASRPLLGGVWRIGTLTAVSFALTHSDGDAVIISANKQ